MNETHHRLDIYEDYRNTTDNPVSKDTHREILEKFNTRAMEKIIYQGQVLEMGWHLSDLYILRVKANPDNPAVNWKASKELKQEIIEDGGTPKSDENPDGEPWLVYHDDDWIAKFHWRKSGCTVPNKTVYGFRATRGDKGNKTKLKERLRTDPTVIQDFRLVDNLSNQ